jgi:hypothetical protein
MVSLSIINTHEIARLRVVGCRRVYVRTYLSALLFVDRMTGREESSGGHDGSAEQR